MSFVLRSSHSHGANTPSLSLHMASLLKGQSCNLQWLVRVINTLAYTKRKKKNLVLMKLAGMQYFYRFPALSDVRNQPRFAREAYQGLTPHLLRKPKVGFIWFLVLSPSCFFPRNRRAFISIISTNNTPDVQVRALF